MVKQKVSKCYENDFLKNILSLLKSLLAAQIVRNSHILTEIYFNFLKKVLDQTWKSFSTKFIAQWKDQKSFKSFGNLWGKSHIPYLLLIIDLRFRLGVRKIWQSIENSQKHYDHGCSIKSVNSIYFFKRCIIYNLFENLLFYYIT